MAPPAGFEPALPPPEGGALSPELRGLGQGTTIPGSDDGPGPLESPGSLRDDPDVDDTAMPHNGHIRASARAEGDDRMSKYLLGYAALAIVAWVLLPNLIALLLIVGVPVAGYLMLDPSQRRRLKGARRGELGR
jgi:hypothetical protein